jgi:hypothetical protein
MRASLSRADINGSLGGEKKAADFSRGQRGIV